MAALAEDPAAAADHGPPVGRGLPPPPAGCPLARRGRPARLREAGRVKLISADGAKLELRLVGYQFGQPDSTRAGESDGSTGLYADWDANWLVIHGDALTSGGQSWSFTDPCLTTWEAEGLALWLSAAARGDEAAGEAVFTEPNLSFVCDGVAEGRVHMRVRFSHESLPSWLPREPVGWQAGEYYLALEVSCADVAEAARAWDADRLQFPVR